MVTNSRLAQARISANIRQGSGSFTHFVPKSMSRLITPYVGEISFVYTQPETGSLMEAESLEALETMVVAHRQANNLPVGSDVLGEIEDQLCDSLPANYCVEDPEPTESDGDSNGGSGGQGEQGEQGPPGVQGPAGVQGPPGAPGPDGGTMPFEINLQTDFGAVLDGVTDDTAAWVAALAAAKVSQKSIRWLGTSRITAQLNWPDLGSNMGINGYGPGQSVILCDFGSSPSTDSGIRFEMTGATNRVHIKNCTIRGANDSDINSPYDLVLINDFLSDVLIENVEFANGRHSGFRISSAGVNAGQRITIRSCRFHEIIDASMSLTAGAAILTTFYSKITIEGCDFTNCGMGLFSHGIYVQDATGLQVLDNTFTGTHSRLHMTGSGNNKTIVRGNKFDSQLYNYVSGSACLVTANVFINSGLRLLDISRCTIHGNLFESDTVINLIDTLGTPTDVTVENNTFSYTGATRTSFCIGFVSDLSVTRLLMLGNTCLNTQLVRIEAGVRPVIVDNIIRADSVDIAVGFITFNGAGPTIDAIWVCRNFIDFTNPVGTPRAVEVNGGVTTVCLENIVPTPGSFVGCSNVAWS